jgi:hypothetical protein
MSFATVPDDCRNDHGVPAAYEAGEWVGRVGGIALVIVVAATVLLIAKRRVRGIVVGCLLAIACAIAATGASYAHMVAVINACSSRDVAASTRGEEKATRPPPPAVSSPDEPELLRLSGPAVAVDSSGVRVNGKLVADAATIAPGDLHRIEPLGAALQSLRDRLDDNGVEGAPVARTFAATIDPAIPSLAAASVMLTMARPPYSDLSVAVGNGGFRVTYLAANQRLPTESYFYFTPHGPMGFSMRRDRITRNLATVDPPCRESSAWTVLASERDMDRAATKLCDPSLVDCVDHVVFALPASRTFGDVLPWITAALHSRALSTRQLAFAPEGSEPVSKAVDCSKH